MSEAKHTAMYESMVNDVIDLCEDSRNPIAKEDVLLGLCLAVEMMLNGEQCTLQADRDALLEALQARVDDCACHPAGEDCYECQDNKVIIAQVEKYKKGGK